MTLDVEPKEFFELLAASVLHDINTSTNNNFELKDISAGYSYKKRILNKFARQIEATVTINKFEMPLVYEASFKTLRGTNTVGYYIEDLQGSALVRYSEVFKGVSSFADINYNFMSIFFKKNTKKRIKNMLRLMESHILNQKKQM